MSASRSCSFEAGQPLRPTPISASAARCWRSRGPRRSALLRRGRDRSRSDHVDHRGLTVTILLGDRRGLDRHRPLRLVAPAGEPHRRADDLDRVRVAAERVRRRRRARGLHRSPCSARTSTWRRSCTCWSPTPRAASGAARTGAWSPRGYTLAIVGPAPFLMFGFDAHCTDCPTLGHPGRRTARRSATIADALTTGLAVGLVGYLVYVLTARWRAASRRPPADARAAAVVGRRADDPGRRLDRHPDGRRRRGRRQRRADAARPDRLRQRPVHVPGRPAARPRRARRRGRRAARAARRGARHRRAARPAGRGARRPAPEGPLLGRGLLGQARRPGRPRSPPTAPGRRSSSRVSASARSCTTAACAPSPRCWTRSPPPRAWRCAPSAWRRAAAPLARPHRRGGPRRSAGGWSATCTTAPSSGSSRSA